ncbi:hypothetical protein [Gloeobacter violaceus]|uniref:Gll2400 protein n=1 Tax=Gloeobacter violaceus (strain ATCC 29082 / PCC 7421) TaxID=251221 RepID=Q7NHY4_GLOVI|nr:hypothetical protein [Gloeobacter violaceus]BAC90341.1 gll2400 [Gloeobacter violaceus PCC 7421]
MTRTATYPGRTRRGATASLLWGPALGCALVVALCVAAGLHLWHLWRFQSGQYAHLSALEAALVNAQTQKQQQQEELVRRFDPQQLQPLLRERYGWVDPRDLIVKLKAPATAPAPRL